MDKNRKILEALKMQPLSDEEKASRHILGRLYGPIATCKESTRNGRKYNKDLWEKALADEIFNEKVANKSLFLELGHPVNREETDMEKICACIPELPKIVDGDLYAVVDILDTKNGQTLKKLCDYGFVPGISSRGSGDIMANDEVDPDTFFLETWDIVQLPAVKKARLSVCESVDTEQLKMKKALRESYDNLSEEDKKLMKEALDNLNINIEEEAPVVEESSVEEIPFEDPEAEKILAEEAEETEIEEAEETEESEEVEKAEDNKETIKDSAADETEVPVEDAEEEKDEEKAEAEQEIEQGEANTVKEFIDNLKEYDGDLILEFKPIVIDGKEYPVENFLWDDSEEGKLVATVNYVPVEEDNKEDELPEDENPVVEIEINSDVESEPEAIEAPEEAIDDGDEEVIESLKEMIRQKDALEDEVKGLKESKAVGDAEVKRLAEELNKYKTAFIRVSELASNSKKFESEAKALNEQLAQRDQTIATLKTKVENTTKLNEGIEANAQKVKVLTEKLNAAKAEAEETSTELASTRKKLNERTELARNYKAKFTAVLNKYIDSKASMLGVRPSDITSRLAESYSLSDIDKVCDEMLTESVGIGRLPTALIRGSRVSMKESTKKPVEKQATVNPENGYDIDDSLLELAGLK